MLRTCGGGAGGKIRLRNKEDVYRGERHSLPTQEMDLYCTPVLAQGLLCRNLFNCALNDDDVGTEGHQTPASDTRDIVGQWKSMFSLSQNCTQKILHQREGLLVQVYAVLWPWQRSPASCCEYVVAFVKWVVFPPYDDSTIFLLLPSHANTDENLVFF